MINEAITTFGKDIDQLVLIIAVIVGFFFFVSEGLFFYFIWRFHWGYCSRINVFRSFFPGIF